MARVQLIEWEIDLLSLHEYDPAHPAQNWNTTLFPIIDVPDDVLSRWKVCLEQLSHLQDELRQVASGMEVVLDA